MFPPNKAVSNAKSLDLDLFFYLNKIEEVLRMVLKQTNYLFERNYHHVICTQGKRSRPRRVRNHSRSRRYRCYRCYALARTQDRQHIQLHQQLFDRLIRSTSNKKAPSFDGAFLFIKALALTQVATLT